MTRIDHPRDLGEAVSVFRGMRKRALETEDQAIARALLRSIRRLDAMRRRAWNRKG